MKLSELGEKIVGIQGLGSVAVITDDNVAKLHLDSCEKSLKDAGLKVYSFIIPAGEESKTGETYLDLLEKLAWIPLTRSDGIVALGGGVVGDMAGFLAATYLRGIKIYQVPTTLLAAVDSSVGGKTGIDLKSGKNLAGAFYPPNLILQDTSLLRTLSPGDFRNGCGEIIKYGVISDVDLFTRLRANPIGVTMDEGELGRIIERCVRIKTAMVSSDLKDEGERRLLNFGHTIGHAVETLSDYKVTHGEAVAKGMLKMAEISKKQGWCKPEVPKDIKDILLKYGFNIEITYGAHEVFEVIEKDKKRRADYIDIVVPEKIGKCRIERVTLDHFKTMLEE